MIKSVLITGGAGNLGKAVCERFLEAGWKVTAVIGPNDETGFIRHEKLYAERIDLFGGPDAESALRELIKKNGPFSFSVLTVGGFGMGGFRQTSLEDLRKMFRLNFETAYTTSGVLCEHFMAAGLPGRIVLFGARPGLDLRYAGEMVAYGLSKSLVIHLAEIINVTGQGKNIDAAVIIPSIIDTPANRKAMPDADFAKWVLPDAIADNIYFLSTESGREQRNVILKMYGNS